jgi:predicted nucleic acid-binding protein
LTIFADTSALYALLDKSDRQHRATDHAWSDLFARNEELVTTNYVVVELVTLAQHRLGLEAVREVITDLLPILDIVWIDTTIHTRALAALLASARRKLRLVDCSSFELMRARGLRTAFAVDRHFSEQGFDTIP